MNIGKKTGLITTGLYVVLALCVLAIMAMSIYSLTKGGEDNILKLDETDDDNILNATLGIKEDDLLMEPTLDDEDSALEAGSPKSDVPAKDTTTAAPTTQAPTTEAPAATQPPKTVSAPVYVKPLDGIVCKEYSIDVPVFSVAMNDYRTHNGIDIAADIGTQVRAMSDGTITKVTEDPLMGYSILIEHANGLASFYGNLQPAVPQNIIEGAQVSAGDVIGGVGESSLIEGVEAPHLHFEVFKDGENVDPAIYVTYK